MDRSVDQLNYGKIQAEFDSRERAQKHRGTQQRRNAQNDSLAIVSAIFSGVTPWRSRWRKGFSQR